MNVTNEMLQAAVKKAVEAGLLPRSACREKQAAHGELMRGILEAALELAPGRTTERTTEAKRTLHVAAAECAGQ